MSTCAGIALLISIFTCWSILFFILCALLCGPPTGKNYTELCKKTSTIHYKMIKINTSLYQRQCDATHKVFQVKSSSFYTKNSTPWSIACIGWAFNGDIFLLLSFSHEVEVELQWQCTFRPRCCSELQLPPHVQSHHSIHVRQSTTGKKQRVCFKAPAVCWWRTSVCNGNSPSWFLWATSRTLWSTRLSSWTQRRTSGPKGQLTGRHEDDQINHTNHTQLSFLPRMLYDVKDLCISTTVFPPQQIFQFRLHSVTHQNPLYVSWMTNKASGWISFLIKDLQRVILVYFETWMYYEHWIPDSNVTSIHSNGICSPNTQ